MKKLLSIILITIIAASLLCGCSNKKTEEKDKHTQITIAKKTINMPCSVSDLDSMGFELVSKISKVKLNNKLKSYATDYVTFMDENGETFIAYVINTKNKEMQYKDCNVYYISGTKRSNSSLTLNNGVSINSSIEDVTSIMGEPEQIYRNKDVAGETVLYYTVDDKDSYKVRIAIKEDKVAKITVQV